MIAIGIPKLLVVVLSGKSEFESASIEAGACWLDSPRRPWVEVDGQRFACHVVDPEGNARRPRPPRRDVPAAPTSPVPFDPSVALAPRTTEETNDDHLF